jgi:hypothetical protein
MNYFYILLISLEVAIISTRPKDGIVLNSKNDGKNTSYDLLLNLLLI